MDKYYWIVPLMMLCGAVAASATGTMIGVAFGTVLTVLAANEWRAYFTRRRNMRESQ